MRKQLAETSVEAGTEHMKVSLNVMWPVPDNFDMENDSIEVIKLG